MYILCKNIYVEYQLGIMLNSSNLGFYFLSERSLEVSNPGIA